MASMMLYNTVRHLSLTLLLCTVCSLSYKYVGKLADVKYENGIDYWWLDRDNSWDDSSMGQKASFTPIPIIF